MDTYVKNTNNIQQIKNTLLIFFISLFNDILYVLYDLNIKNTKNKSYLIYVFIFHDINHILLALLILLIHKIINIITTLKYFDENIQYHDQLSINPFHLFSIRKTCLLCQNTQRE